MEYEGNFLPCKGRFLVLASRFNRFITSKLVDGAKEFLVEHGIEKSNIDEMWVPGAYELPLAAKAATETKRYVAIVALGCVIRGGTVHFDYVCSTASNGLVDVSQSTGVPLGIGLLTTDNTTQAIERAGVKMGNKGSEAAASALYMVNLLNGFEGL